MTASLVSRNRIPYGGRYIIRDPLSGVEVLGTNFDMLCDRIYAARKANSLPIGVGIEQEIEQWICQQYPQECENLDPAMPRKRTFTLTDIIHGSRVMLSHWWNGRKLVDRAEAERRAQICMNCPLNVAFAKPCTGICKELNDVVNAITGTQGTQYDVHLKSCSNCGCFLSASIWVPLEIQLGPLDETTKLKFENTSGCWKKPSLIPA